MKYKEEFLNDEAECPMCGQTDKDLRNAEEFNQVPIHFAGRDRIVWQKVRCIECGEEFDIFAAIFNVSI
jgi:C4-type Zn-finger protein